MINKEVVKEIYNQGKERLQDLLEIKKSFEQKAFILLTGFIALSTCFFGICASLFEKNIQLAISFGCVAFGFFIASIFAVLVLKTSKYGTLGSDPDMWLKLEYKEGNEETLSYMFIYLSEFYQERINKSRKSNKLRAVFINISVLAGIISPLFFILPYLL